MNNTKTLPAGTEPDSDFVAMETVKFRASLVMLASRDVANVCIKHALEIEGHGDIHTARIFDAAAKEFRRIERAAAAAAGVTAD